jgi:predicted hydrolase (HD superfamily)
MMKSLTREEAWKLFTRYNKDPFHIQHALTVEGVMRWYAKELGFGDDAEFWAEVGLLHDIDFGEFPAEHCIKARELLAAGGGPEIGVAAKAEFVCVPAHDSFNGQRVLDVKGVFVVARKKLPGFFPRQCFHYLLPIAESA